MPRDIILQTPRERTVPLLTASAAAPGTLSRGELDKRLRLRRSPAYLQALAKLDAGGHTCDPAHIARLLAAIQEELPEVAVAERPQAIVSRCYLGRPYEIHSLDASGAIVQHYKSGEALPAAISRARTLAQHDAYIFIEVYSDCLRAVTTDGDVCVIQR